VTANVGELPYILVDGSSALLCEDGTADTEADPEIRILQDPKLAGMLSVNARSTVEVYSWENILPRWKRIFEEFEVAK